MATRLNHGMRFFQWPVARELLTSTARRLRPGGLAAGIAPPSQGKAFVIVTGPGRSGTSAVARVLHESGIRMGSDLGRPSSINPDGFYEELDVVRLHERLLADLGMSDGRRPERWPWRSTVLAAATKYRDEMEALLSRAGDGWKDPRFSVTLEAWLPFLPARPKLVICLRSPRAHADSVVHRFGFVDREMVERRWARHNRRILDVIRDYKLEATCVEYDALVERPEETVASLSGFVGRSLEAKYVNASRRQFTRAVPEKYARLYQEVRALGGWVSPPGATVVRDTRIGSDAAE